MSKKQKSSSLPSQTIISPPHPKILPHKQHFVTFQSAYDYGDRYPVIPLMVKNPKWCHLELKLGHSGCCRKYDKLRRAKSLRLRSLHLESFSLDSQGCGDQINGYFGELESLERAGHTLKNLTLSVTLDDNLLDRNKKDKKDVYKRLERFVKKQKHLQEFAFYNGTRRNPKPIADWLKYCGRTLKTLTIENLTSDDLFTKYEFPNLEVLRFEYILFYGSERSFDLTVLIKCFEQIMSLRSLQALKIIQYQRYDTDAYYEMDDEDEEEEEKVDEENQEDPGYEQVAPNVWSSSTEDGLKNLMEALTKSFQKEAELKIRNRRKKETQFDMAQLQEFPLHFWEIVRGVLDHHKEKQLKVKYHKMEESDIEKRKENLERIFKGLPAGQGFEYEVRQIEPFNDGYGFESRTKSINSWLLA